MAKHISATEGYLVRIVLTNMAMHGSGQIFSKPGFTLDAGITERLTFPVSYGEWAVIKDHMPSAGELLTEGDPLVPGQLLQAEYDLELKSVEVVENATNREMDIKLEWIRWALNYDGFKLKGLGLKGSMLPLLPIGSETTDLWSLFPDADLIVNLEAAKGSALTLAMWAETLEGGLDVGPDGLSPEQTVAYEAWFDAALTTRVVQHLIDPAIAPYYEAAGHTIIDAVDGTYVVQRAEFMEGRMVVEVEAPLVPHRTTMSSLSLMQSLLIAAEAISI